MRLCVHAPQDIANLVYLIQAGQEALQLTAAVCVRAPQDIANLVQMSQVGQEALRLTAARVSCALAYHAVMMATAAGEEGAVKLLARLDVELMKVSGRGAGGPGTEGERDRARLWR